MHLKSPHPIVIASNRFVTKSINEMTLRTTANPKGLSQKSYFVIANEVKQSGNR
jgi:hypothetical protein